jgi:hypothetical protein
MFQLYAKHFYGRKKMYFRKTAQRAKPDCGFAEAEPPKGGEAHTDLLSAVGAYTIISYNYLQHFLSFK